MSVIIEAPTADKVSWDDIFKDFKRRHPNLKKMVMRWEPFGFATVRIFLKDSAQLVYNYDTKQAKFIVMGRDVLCGC
jgi:hypothetical protein